MQCCHFHSDNIFCGQHYYQSLWKRQHCQNYRLVNYKRLKKLYIIISLQKLRGCIDTDMFDLYIICITARDIIIFIGKNHSGYKYGRTGLQQLIQMTSFTSYFEPITSCCYFEPITHSTGFYMLPTAIINYYCNPIKGIYYPV